MKPDDVFDRERAQLRSALERWYAPYADHAAASFEHAPTFTRLGTKPHAKAACGLDVVIDVARQTMAMEVGSETYEQLPAIALQGLVHLFDAAAKGVIVTRRWHHLQSGRHVATDTVFQAHAEAEASIAANRWQLRQIVTGRSTADIGHALARDQRYAPWTRA